MQTDSWSDKIVARRPKLVCHNLLATCCCSPCSFYPTANPLLLLLLVSLYSFGEFRSISFAFAHLLIKWPTTLQVAAAAAVAVAIASLRPAGINVSLSILVVDRKHCSRPWLGDTSWPGCAGRQVQGEVAIRQRINHTTAT